MTNILESFTEVEAFPTRARTKGNKSSNKYLPLIDALKETPGKGRSIVMPYNTDDDKAAVRAIVQHVRQAAKERDVTALKDVSDPVTTKTGSVDEDGNPVDVELTTVTVTFAVTAKVTKAAKAPTTVLNVATGEESATLPGAEAEDAPEAPAEVTEPETAPEPETPAEAAPEVKPAGNRRPRR